MKKRPEILTIAGFDPSAGAGVLADIKTFEKLRCYGFAVQTANTIQTSGKFSEPNWVPVELIIKQLREILSTTSFKWVKIGLVESLTVLREIIDCLGEFGKHNIIWDPILSASAGFDFEHDLSEAEGIIKDCYLITPNKEEAQQILAGEVEQSALKLSEDCRIYMTSSGRDELFINGMRQQYKAKAGSYFEKHGSGCVLSSALTAHLALGYPIHRSILRSKRYIEHYLASTQTLLGYHT